MAKNFTKNNPLKGNPNDRFVPDNKPMKDQIELTTEQPEEDLKPAAEQPIAAELGTPKVPKRKPGRPKTKTEPERYINISVPVSVMNKLDEVKPCFGGNLTAYINRLIVKDLEENYDKYLDFIKLL